ncbi:MAG: selenium-dependent xanthine dehydrogenase [Clostridia bacterium]|nr:selenium-dependent xanthine dehydrogenase [Clostridia bacterium]
MAQFYVNGNPVTVEKNRKLLPYLRDELKLTSVKNGCSEGACGTCMVLLDGKAMKACVLQTDKLEGKHVVTVEGLTEREREVYAFAFAEAGAVQCGFCTPGMIISAKGLLDVNPDPTRDDVKKAIKNNICRCTGYKKIEEAILMAAKLFQSGEEVPYRELKGIVGENLPRVDAKKKALGEMPYADDISPDWMLHVSAVRAKYPKAEVRAIHTEKALALPGVFAVFTAEDVPCMARLGHLVKDWPVMVPVGEKTRFLGDAIALVAAVDKETLEKGKELVEVEYGPEEEGVFDPIEALKEDAPIVHPDKLNNLLSVQSVKRGDAEAAIANSKYVVTNKYYTPWTEHAFLEPETAVAVPTEDGVTIYTGDQGSMQTRREVCEMLGLSLEQVRVITCAVGGGFGGKEDQVCQHHAALVAYLLKRPAKVSLTRAESMLIHPKRHPMYMEITTGCDENGIIQGMKARIISDTGAYASLGGPVLQRACTHAGGPYNYQNFDVEGRAAYTNNPPAGAYRGFGVTQSCFAAECNLNQLAEMVGISPFEIRYRNAIRPGQELPNGQLADENCNLVATLDAVRPYYEANPKAGIACCMKNSGLGVGIPDFGRCKLQVQEGKVHIHCSASCIGQGFGTVATQILCTQAGISHTDTVYHEPDTRIAPDSGNTTASRQTLISGEAVRRAAEKLEAALKQKGSLAALNGKVFLGEFLGLTDPMGSDKPNPVSHVDYGYATQMVELNEDGKLKRVIAAHDVGRAINPVSLVGQVEGGVVMSLGYALTEQYPLEKGKPLAKFGTLGLFKAPDVPEIETIIVEGSNSPLAFGAKGIGEITSIPTAPAVQLAYYNYDGKFRTELPLEDTPYSRRKK